VPLARLRRRLGRSSLEGAPPQDDGFDALVSRTRTKSKFIVFPSNLMARPRPLLHLIFCIAFAASHSPN
jgi:hypothetical protein